MNPDLVLSHLKNLLSSEHTFSDASPVVRGRTDAVLELLNRAAGSAGDPGERLSCAYFRRSLEVVASPERFLALTIIAPVVAAGKRKKKRRGLFDVVLCYHDWYRSLGPTEALERAFRTEPGKSYLGVNRHQGIAWYDRERFGDFIFRMYTFGLIEIHAGSTPEDIDVAEESLFQVIGQWVQARHASRYQVERLLSYLWSSSSPTAASRSDRDVS